MRSIDSAVFFGKHQFMTIAGSQTLVERAVEIIENMIFNGSIKAGDWINVQNIVDESGISRTPFREALQHLEARGLIENIPHRGSFVKAINVQEISDVIEIRIALEGVAVRLAHKRLNKEGLQELKKLLDGMRAALTRKNVKRFISLHEQYHMTLISYAGNVWLTKELYSLRKITRWHRFYFQYHEKNFSYSLASHEQQYRMLSDPLANEDELVRIDAETTRYGCDLLLEHIRKTEAERKEAEPQSQARQSVQRRARQRRRKPGEKVDR